MRFSVNLFHICSCAQMLLLFLFPFLTILFTYSHSNLQEHLFLVCELLRANLYEFQKYNKESGEDLYFTNARIQKIAISVLK